MKKFDFELIMCICNKGFSDTVMDAAKAVGVTGGTVISARGTANSQMEKTFGITIHPEKEIVMTIVSENIKDKVLKAVYESVGYNTACKGIAFAIPVDNVVGINSNFVEKMAKKVVQKAEEAEKAKEEAEKKPAEEKVEENKEEKAE